MKRQAQTPEAADMKRRFLLAASAGLILPRLAWAQSRDHVALCWKLEESGDTAREVVHGAQDAIASRTGHALWVGEGRNRALRFDGYSVWFRHNCAPGTLRGGTVTVMAWVALESFPVNEAAILQLDNASKNVFRLAIDKWGYLQFGAHPSEAKNLCKSAAPLPKAVWVHLAASIGESGATLYLNGVQCSHVASFKGRIRPSDNLTVVVGGAPDCPMSLDLFPTGVLNGLLRDVRLHEAELSRAAIEEIMEEGRPTESPDLQLNGTWCASDPQRPIAHAIPSRSWTNEPHGLIYWKGLYHLFYQKNPNGPYWGHLQWGHMTSTDLYHWSEMPVALSPEPGFDSEGCWSGSVIDCGDRLALIYTGVDGVKAGIALAFSEDGIHFKKHPGNPVIPEPPRWGNYLDFRDPFVWREGDVYYLIVGSGIKDAGGTALLYRSNNLIHWEYRKQLYSGTYRNSGTFWEMPVFIRLGKLYALIVCEIPGRASYWIGAWKDEIFTPTSHEPRRLELFNHLLSPTPMVSEDGQVMAMGIIPEERSPSETWAAGWANLYSLPRQLTADDRGNLLQRPHSIIERWSTPLASLSEVALKDGEVWLPKAITGKSLRIRTRIARGDSSTVSVWVRRTSDGQEETGIIYDWQHGQLILERTRSSLNPRVKRDRQIMEYLVADKDAIELDLFVDHSVLEVFIDDRVAFATRIYPILATSDGVGFSATGSGARIEMIHVASLGRSA